MPQVKNETTIISNKLKGIAASFGAVVAILGSIWAIDTHYASAADVAAIKQDLTSQIQQMRVEKVEDQLFELDAKKAAQNGKLSPQDQAMYDRYMRRLQSIQDENKSSTTGTSR